MNFENKEIDWTANVGCVVVRIDPPQAMRGKLLIPEKARTKSNVATIEEVGPQLDGDATYPMDELWVGQRVVVPTNVTGLKIPCEDGSELISLHPSQFILVEKNEEEEAA